MSELTGGGLREIPKEYSSARLTASLSRIRVQVVSVLPSLVRELEDATEYTDRETSPYDRISSPSPESSAPGNLEAAAKLLDLESEMERVSGRITTAISDCQYWLNQQRETSR